MENIYVLFSDGELYHYGVKGMKWGIRRYQNADGSLTAAGRKRAKQEYKEDNDKAFELGRDATITGHAAARSTIRTNKFANRLSKRREKDPNDESMLSKSLVKKYNASSKTTKTLTSIYEANRSKAEAHCKSLIEKYGNEAVSSIKYTEYGVAKGKNSMDKFKTVNEDVHKLSMYAITGAANVVSVAMSVLLGSPITMIYTPKTKAQYGNEVEYDLYRANLKNERKK